MSGSNHQSTTISGGNTIEIFRELALEYQEFAAEAGVKVVPFWDPELPHFAALNLTSKMRAIEALKVAIQICREAQANGHRMDDNAAILWHALKSFGLRPPSDLLSHLTDSAVVEIYSSDNVQLFRSFSFFAISSYTLEELHCLDWVTLFARKDPAIIEKIIGFVTDAFTGKVTGTIPLDHIPPHEVFETSSLHRFIQRTTFTWGGPLYHAGTQQVAAVVGFQDVVLLGRQEDEISHREPRLSLVTPPAEL